MMARVTTSPTPRWAAGVLVGMVTVLWTALPIPSVPAVGAAEQGSLPKTVNPNRVTGVEVVEVGPMSATVLIKTDRVVESYESFFLPDPPRVVIDIPNAVHAVPAARSGRGPITQIRASQYKTRPAQVVRIVLDLSSGLPYQVQTAPGSFRVLLGEAMAEAARPEAPPAEVPEEALPQAPVPTQAVTAPASNSESRVERVDYQPKDGQAEMLIRTSGDVTFNVSEVSTPPGLILDVSGAVIDPQAAKVLDVRELPGPVQRIRAAQHRLEPEKMVRIQADLKRPVRYEVSETPEGIRLTLESVPAVAAAPPPPQEAAKALEQPIPAPAPPVVQAPPAAVTPAVSTARISMDFKDADINNLLRIIAEVSGQNIVSGQDVQGKVTVRLVDVPWDQALDSILRINGFGFVQEDNIIRVAKLATIRKEQEERRKEQMEWLRLQEEAPTEPLQTEILRVSYAYPAKVVQNLNRVKSKRGSISVDDRTASLLIQDTESNLEKMRVLLKELDQPTPQVMIEGRIVNVNTNFTRSLGVEWGFQLHNRAGG